MFFISLIYICSGPYTLTFLLKSLGLKGLCMKGLICDECADFNSHYYCQHPIKSKKIFKSTFPCYLSRDNCLGDFLEAKFFCQTEIQIEACFLNVFT